MNVLWVNSGTTDTLSNTRLHGIIPVFNEWGDKSHAILGGKSSADLPDYFIIIPVPLGKQRLYWLLVTLLLPFLCLKYKTDIILTDWMSARLTYLVILLKKVGLLKCKLVHDVRTVPVREDSGKAYRAYSGSLKYAQRHFDGLTTITNPLRDEICAEFGFPESKIGVWTSGVNVDHFKPQNASGLRKELGLEGKFVVFYHGAVNENRGVIELAGAAEHLRDLPDLRIIIVGRGNRWSELETVIKQKSLEQVILKPGVPYAEIPRWVAMADLCAVPLPDHPWWRVSSPLKLMEYLAMEKPVLLTEMPAHRAVIPDDKDAFYVPSANPEMFAVGIRRAISQKERFKEMGETGRHKAKSILTWEMQAKFLHDYFDKVLQAQINLN
ncbi:hypothetical protein CEE37_03000 [candidate division LCP-89 bacterium B3_LCP]|uniref:Glycosyl transferase family 1 domain-containing protein n=1 Tax=candidate division LCP-89 bacterium B3_LCP TaxID=2012998 RepID=A0A532V3H3_UNCL8|nr:MAG: hypothetical protein CEE37_03000 [candidate division LCP-89 bacterium B3_LCP]